MTLDEAFEKFDDTTLLRRRYYVERLLKRRPDLKESDIGDSGAHSVEFLKGMKSWGNQESRRLGFLIPDFMIEDANADDWEVVKCGK